MDSKSNSNEVGCETEAVDGTVQKLDSGAMEINEEDLELDSSTEKCADAPTKRKHSDSECESDVSTDDNRLVIECIDMEERSNRKCTTIRNGRKSISEKLSHSNGEDSHMTRSKTRLIANLSHVNQIAGEKQVHFVSHDHEMDSMSSHKDTSEATDSSHSKKSLEDVTVSNCCDATDNTLCSEVSDSAASINVSTGSKQDCSVSKHYSAQEVSEEEQTKIKKVDLNLLNPNFNISYRLWKLCKDEGHLEDRKEGFLKGECPNREIDVLVRCKVDGHKVENKKKKKSVCLVPKMEYLPEYGAQCLTQSELTRQWISLYVRPGADLCRVRVNACTSEVMMIEQHSVQEVTQEAVQVGRPTSVMLGTLYNVLLGLVDLEAGSYLLSHTPKLGAFVNVWQSTGNGRFNLHDMYKVDTMATAVSDSSLWIPIDHKVMTPFHWACKRVPGIFPPTCFVRGKPFSKKKTSTKRNKKTKSK